MKKKTCCFFGHRTVNDDIFSLLKTVLTELIVNDGYEMFMFGCQGAFDEIVYKVLKEIKTEYPHIDYCMVAAYRDRVPDGMTYDECLYPEILERVPLRYAISARNKWMAEQSQCAVVYVKYITGGAYTSTKYAEKKNLKIINIMQYI